MHSVSAWKEEEGLTLSTTLYGLPADLTRGIVAAARLVLTSHERLFKARRGHAAEATHARKSTAFAAELSPRAAAGTVSGNGGGGLGDELSRSGSPSSGSELAPCILERGILSDGKLSSVRSMTVLSRRRDFPLNGARGGRFPFLVGVVGAVNFFTRPPAPVQRLAGGEPSELDELSCSDDRWLPIFLLSIPGCQL